MSLGILAEDETDCDALAEIARRVMREHGQTQIGIVKWSGGGCAKLRRKASAKLADMVRSGCRATVLVHDLDRHPETGVLNDEQALRQKLDAIQIPNGLSHVHVVPVEEIEAWFWADEKVLKMVGRGKGKAAHSPHSIARPKEALMRLSAAANKKPRYFTSDNVKLAKVLDTKLCAQRCPSFAAFVSFVATAYELITG